MTNQMRLFFSQG